jgi:hypothetical protein
LFPFSGGNVHSGPIRESYSQSVIDLLKLCVLNSVIQLVARTGCRLCVTLVVVKDSVHTTALLFQVLVH